MKENRQLIITVLLVLAGIIVSWYLGSRNKAPKMAFVKADELFSGFVMTKELQSNYDNTLSTRQHILDSLAAVIKVSASANNRAQAIEAEKAYLLKKDLFEQQNAELTEKYDHQVWLRIHEYVKQYCEREHIDYLQGMNGNSSLLYAGESHNITTQVLEFMNKSYQEGKQ